MEKLQVITAVNEIDREQPYTAETFRLAGAKKLERLREIKALLESEDYEQKRIAFDKERDRLTQNWQRYTEHIRDWEMQMTEKIMNDPTLSDEEKGRKMQSEVYVNVQEMFRRAESSEGYKRAIDEYRAFLKQNELMDEATGYHRERTSPEVEPFFNLAQAFAGEEPDVIEFEMPSDSIYDQMALWEEYAERGYLDDFNRAFAEDERAKKLSAMQLEYLFSVCDTVCFHAEKYAGRDEEPDVRFAEILDGAYRTEETENYGMQVLRIYLKPTVELKEYLLSFKRFDRYHYDAYERYAPYLCFADIAFLKDGEVLLSCLTHEGYSDVSDDIKPVFNQFEAQV
ncbi:MAG: hypothetical protein ACI4S9_05270 [Christensenellales bacterium]